MRWYRWIAVKLGLLAPPVSSSYRSVHINHHEPLEELQVFPDNRIVSSKYTAWDFLPKNLFEQFRRIANFYFLCVSIIQLSIDSPVSPVTSIAPLIFVVAVTAIKQAYEDWLRHKSDLQVNNRAVRVLRSGQLARIKAKDVQVGDIVYVVDEHKFPCDLIMLSSSNEDGRCNVTTANLDGETNLKVFQCVADTRSYQTPESLTTLHATIQCEQPTSDLYLFRGRLHLHGDYPAAGGDGATSPASSRVISLNQQNLLLNGARLKNTRFIYGCAVYTGQETKMAINSVYQGKNKWSTIEKGMNKFLAFFLVVLLSEVALCTGLKYWMAGQPSGRPWYNLSAATTNITAKGVIQDLFAFLVLFNYIIPISLYVTIEMQKFLGARFLVWDCDLYDKERNLPCKVNSSDLNEELGQVEYLFSDKTGTLTENDMIFRRCCAGSRQFADVNGRLFEVIDGQTQNALVDLTQSDVMAFFQLLVLCHTVEINDPSLIPLTSSEALVKGKGPRRKGRSFSDESMRLRQLRGEVLYEGASPDETAFVSACRRYGVVFKAHTHTTYTINYLGQEATYEVLRVLEFDADRKRMSLVIRIGPDTVKVMVKGAETSVLPRCIAGNVEAVQRHIDHFAQEGLRTLAMGERVLSNDQWLSFVAGLNEANNLLVDREAKVREMYEQLESELTLVGATGVEDRLQDGVQETLETLRVAGIKTWILTGDKQETAVNVSYACGHFKKSMQAFHLTKCEEVSTCETLLQTMKQTMTLDGDKQYCMTIDGPSLNVAQQHHAGLLQEVTMSCVAVLCCRMSPIQKAQIVKMIKDSPSQPVTAAIGDGANDVSMIQEAHVGLGIFGKEGRQAARAADFAFGRFRMLMKMLIVHGHWYYYRVSTLVQYFFYKNVAFITPQVFFAFFSAYSEQPVFDQAYLTLFNIIFTSLPILAFGLFEQDMSAASLLQQPQIYSEQRKNARLSKKEFAKWMAIAVWHAVVFFFGFYALFVPNGGAVLDSSGQTYDLWTFGTAVFTLVIIVVNLKLLLYSSHWNGFLLGAVAVSFLCYAALSVIYNATIWKGLVSPDMYWIFFKIWCNAAMPLNLLLLTVAALIPDLVWQVAHKTQQMQRHQATFGPLANSPARPPPPTPNTRPFLAGLCSCLLPSRTKCLWRDKYQVDGNIRGRELERQTAPTTVQVVVRNKAQREMHYFSSNGHAQPSQSASSQQQENSSAKLVTVSETII